MISKHMIYLCYTYEKLTVSLRGTDGYYMSDQWLLYEEPMVFGIVTKFLIILFPI